MARKKYQEAVEAGERIRLARKNKGLSMEELGFKLSPPASKGAVSNWENGYNLPNNDRLEQLARILNVSVSYLLTGKRIPFEYQSSMDIYNVHPNDETQNIIMKLKERMNNLNTTNLNSSKLAIIDTLLNTISNSEFLSPAYEKKMNNALIELSGLIENIGLFMHFQDSKHLDNEEYSYFNDSFKTEINRILNDLKQTIFE